METAVDQLFPWVQGHCWTSLLRDEFPDEMQGCVDCHMSGKAFWDSRDCGSGKSITGRDDESISRIYIYFSEDKYLPPLWEKKSRVIDMLTGSWLVLPRNGVISCPGTASIPATTATLFISSLSKKSGDWRKRLIDIHRLHHSVHLLSSQSVLSRSHRSTCLFPRLPHIHTADPLYSCQKQQRTLFLPQRPSGALYWQSSASCSL